MKSPNYIAAKLYSLRKLHKDDNLWLLHAYRFLKEGKIEEILESYKKILNGEIKIVYITSSIKLNDQQTKKIEDSIYKEFPNQDFAFNYSFDKDVKNGIEIKIGDNLINLFDQAITE